MSNVEAQAENEMVHEHAAPLEQTAGSMLRQAREAQGMHIATLAVALKVPVAKLQMLEDDQLRKPTDMAFIRALAGSVCRALRIDPSPILAALPQTSSNMLKHEEEIKGLNEPFMAHDPTVPVRPKFRFNNLIAIAVAALVLATLALLFAPSDWFNRIKLISQHETVKTEGAEKVAAAETKIAVPSSAPSVALPASAPMSANAAMGGAASVASVNGSAVTEMAVPAPSAGASAAAPSASLPVSGVVDDANAVNATLYLESKGDSWVTVRDVDEKKLFNANLVAGKKIGVMGKLPFRVTVGRKSEVSVKVHGKDFDINHISDSPSARFQVKE